MRLRLAFFLSILSMSCATKMTKSDPKQLSAPEIQENIGKYLEGKKVNSDYVVVPRENGASSALNNGLQIGENVRKKFNDLWWRGFNPSRPDLEPVPLNEHEQLGATQASEATAKLSQIFGVRTFNSNPADHFSQYSHFYNGVKYGDKDRGEKEKIMCDYPDIGNRNFIPYCVYFVGAFDGNLCADIFQVLYFNSRLDPYIVGGKDAYGQDITARPSPISFSESGNVYVMSVDFRPDLGSEHGQYFRSQIIKRENGQWDANCDVLDKNKRPIGRFEPI